MKKYEYVKVVVNNNPVANAKLEEYREVINTYAAKGYSYVGYIPAKQGPSGKIIEFDLIFETEV